jgi:hypothetical protein
MAALPATLTFRRKDGVGPMAQSSTLRRGAFSSLKLNTIDEELCDIESHVAPRDGHRASRAAHRRSATDGTMHYRLT